MPNFILSRSTLGFTAALLAFAPALAAAQTGVYQYNQTNLEFTSERGFISGDPDRPIITGTAATPEQDNTSSGDAATEVDTTDQEAGPAFLKIDGVEGESKDEAKKGKVEMTWKVEEGEKLTPVFAILDGIPPADDEEAAGSVDDRLKTAGPTNGWPKGGVRIAVADVKGLTSEQKQAILATIKPVEQVANELDLQNFALGIMLADDQPAETMSLNYEEIKFTYNLPAKLFGIIPASYTAKVSIDRGNNENWDFGRVKVKFPWFSFLLRKGTSAQELTQVLQQEAEAKKKGNVEYSWKVEEGTKAAEDETESESQEYKDEIEVLSWSWGSTAQALQTISNVLKAKHDTVKNSIGNVR